MTGHTKQIPVSSIILDDNIYPRKGIDHRRVGIFAENIRDGFTFDPIEKDLDGTDPLLYAAAKAIGPKQLTEDEAKDTARRAYSGNTRLTSTDIGKAIGRSRQTVDLYLTDLRAVNQMDRDIKIFRLNRLGIPQDRMAKRLGLDQKTIHYHLGKMPMLANSLNGDLTRGFTVAQVAEKHILNFSRLFLFC